MNKEIILDSTLTFVVKGSTSKDIDYGFFFQHGDQYNPVTVFEAEVFHRNYLHYLAMCWKSHYGVIISPTILWNMILNNMAFEVNKRPEAFRKYFTASDKKIEIVVEQDGNQIDVNLLIQGVAGLIPANILPHCFPDLTTDTEKSRIANYTAFLDMVSPYYNYGMFCCGIPKVKILGTYEDWKSLAENSEIIGKIIPEFENYLLGVRLIIYRILNDSCDFSQIFRLERCGSGSQVEVEGWIRDFYIELPRVGYLENFIPCIAKIDYHNYNDGLDYRMYSGLFKSTEADGYLVPEFDNQYFLKANQTKPDAPEALALGLQTIIVNGDKTVKN
jgi:hypothetical protein